MAQHTQDMSQVGGWGEAHPEGSFKFRLDKVKDENDGKLVLIHKNQDEPLVGKTIADNIDLSSREALSKLKTYYKVGGYEPPPGTGHDPENIVGMEFTATVIHNVSKGNVYANIQPWSIRRVDENPAQPLGLKQQ